MNLLEKIIAADAVVGCGRVPYSSYLLIPERLREQIASLDYYYLYSSMSLFFSQKFECRQIISIRTYVRGRVGPSDYLPPWGRTTPCRFRIRFGEQFIFQLLLFVSGNRRRRNQHIRPDINSF